MKKIDNCENSTVLVALLLAGILLVMGGYRIFSCLCENGGMNVTTFLPGADGHADLGAGRGGAGAGGAGPAAGKPQLPAAEGAASVREHP